MKETCRTLSKWTHSDGVLTVEVPILESERVKIEEA
jgi:hypothetical protein